MNVVFFSNIPAPYFVEFLNLLSERCKIEAVFERRKASDRDKSWDNLNSNFKCSYLKGIKIGQEQALSFEVIKACKINRNSLIVIANPMTPTGILSNIYCRTHGIPFAMLSEGGLHGTGKGIKERFKAFLIDGAAYYFSGMKIDNDYFAFYGAEKERIHHYSFSSFHENEMIKKEPGVEEVESIKEELGITKKIVFLYAGRIMRGKGIDVLLLAFKNINLDSALYIVGGEATSEYDAIIQENHIKNVIFVPYTRKEVMKKYYMCADCTILPTRSDTWGLVVNESLSLGTPVITTTDCVAGLELIENGKNGYVVTTDDVTELRDKMIKIACDDKLRASMRKNAIHTMKQYTYENMAKEVYDGLLEFEEIAKRRNIYR